MDRGQVCDELVSIALESGATNARVVAATAVKTDPIYRELCRANACGVYGKCHTCPPDIGEVETLVAQLKAYDALLVYQRVSALEDSFDFEGMSRARVAQYALTKRLRDALRDRLESPLHLGAGGCGECAVCSKVYNAPCVAPDRAIASLEAYTIDVSALAKESGLAYHSGANTVTYFGAVFFKWESVRE